MAKSSKPEQPRPADSKHAEVHWEGDSKEVLCSWPSLIRVDFGHALHEMQEGRPATLEVRPMPSIGKGVFELKTDDEAAWYRMMYLARIDDVIYVLDCFKKKTKKTERKDVARSESRYKLVQQRILEVRRNAKR